MIVNGSSPRGLSEVSTTTSLPTAGRPAHQRTFAAITITAAAKHSDDPALARSNKLASHGDDIAQGIISMGIIHDDGKVLPAIDRLESPGHKLQRRCALSDLLQREATSNGSGSRSQ